VLVTDTAGDVRDALDAGIRAVGVAWGMHDSDELTEAGAEFVAIWPQELPGYLLGDRAAAPAAACAVPAGTGAMPGTAAEAGCGAAAGGCACGCTEQAREPEAFEPRHGGTVTAQLAAAAAIRRGRRQRAARAAPAPGRPLPRPAALAGELRDAVRRILNPD
jgi:phosphoglycolate phosphatase